MLRASKINFRFQPVWQGQNALPFVGLDRPFIGVTNPSDRPVVRYKRPFIGTKQNLGFSLVELAITLAIAIILMAMAFPAFQGFIQDNRLKTQTNEIVASLQMARSEAAKQKTRVTICAVNRKNNKANCDPEAADQLANCQCLNGGDWDGGWMVWTDKNGDRFQADGVTPDQNFPNQPEELLKFVDATHKDIGITAGATTMDYLPDGTTTSPVGALTFNVCDARPDEFGRQITIALSGRPDSEKFKCP